MTTVAFTRPGSALGLCGVRRGNSISYAELVRLPPLADYLRSMYSAAASYLPYSATINQLTQRVGEALSFDSNLEDEAKERLRGAALHAHDFLVNRPQDVPPPEVDVWDDGRVGLEWYAAPDRVITATIDNEGRLAFASMLGVERGTGMRTLDGQWPSDLATWTQRLTE